MIDAELGELDLPPDQVDAVVTADHPAIVHRYLELHGERLQERLADQLRTLERLERLLAPAILGAASRPRGGRPSGEAGRPLHGRAVDPATEGRPCTCRPPGLVGSRGG